MKLRIAAIILIALFIIGGNTALAKSRHHHKGVVSSQKIGQSVNARAGHHKKLAKHSGSRLTSSSMHSKKSNKAT